MTYQGVNVDGLEAYFYSRLLPINLLPPCGDCNYDK